MPVSINELLTLAVEQGASDLHLKVGGNPMMRLNGQLIPATEQIRLGREDTEAMAASVLTPAQRQRFDQRHEVDLAHSVPGLGRFRCNIFRQRGTVGLVLRLLPMGVKSIDDLELPQILKTICCEERGLILVTGSTGSGKTSTLAAMVDHINGTRHTHAVTIEDPIEYLHRDRLSIVNQREVGVDTESFAQALRGALRQDPDIIMVGEMRDSETIATALVAAETGHLVLSTLHTLDATETINRIVTVFEPHQQHQVRLQLASVIRAVISQRLIPRTNGRGRCAALEVMVTTPFIRDCIADPDRTTQIHEAIARGTSQYGMQTFDQAIYAFYRRGIISYEDAVRFSTNADEFKLKEQGITGTSELARDEMAKSVGGLDPNEIVQFGR